MRLNDLSAASMHDLFRQEADNQVEILNRELLALENDARDPRRLEALMRAAHSIKGAARILNLELPVKIAHAMEDCFVAAQKGAIVLERTHVDVLLVCVDSLKALAAVEEADVTAWNAANSAQTDELLARLAVTLSAAPGTAVDETNPITAPSPTSVTNGTSPTNGASKSQANDATQSASGEERNTRVVRVSANHLDRLLGLVGESLVESRSLTPFADSLIRLKRLQGNLTRTLDILREVTNESKDMRTSSLVGQALTEAHACRQMLAERQEDLDLIVRRSTDLAHRLYHETHTSRMRPFGDCAQGFPRMVRDLARTLGKDVRLEIIGEATLVDRDILEKLEAPLTHLLRNAIDHGIELPETRVNAGKPAEGIIRLEARHSAGLLFVELNDDGRGVSLDALRQAVVQKGLTTPQTAARLTTAELLEFLFLPGFTMKERVTEISGRGVGLDVVQSMVREVRGSVHVDSQLGRGARFQLQLPLTLSVMRALIVEIGGEPYALPLGRVRGTLKLERDKIETLEGRQYFTRGHQSIGLVSGASVLEVTAGPEMNAQLPVVLVGDRAQQYAVAVEKFLGERELVVQTLDARLGKVRNIGAGSLLPNGAPVLIVDLDDFIRSIELLISGGRIANVQHAVEVAATRQSKRVLVVDDSLTVRELERKLLSNAGYHVEVAVDGMDGWNAARTHQYDLVITDVDMPRMDGIELVTLIRKDGRLKSLPVMIVSYKDREQDRQRGLDAGADYYLTKGSFHDETLIHSVEDLIGKARA